MTNFNTSPEADGRCPACDSTDLGEAMVARRIPFDEDGDSFEAVVPVITCKSCAFSFTDHRAEAIRHAAACAHDGLMAPDEVKAVRKGLGLSRKDFAEAFGIPPASVDRWENGRLIQNRSMDTLLRALAMPAIAARLDRRKKTPAAQPAGNVIYVQFGRLAATPGMLEDAERREAGFALRAAG